MGVSLRKRIGATGVALAFLSLAPSAAISACGSSSNAPGPNDGGASRGPDSGFDDSSSAVDAWTVDAPATPSCEAGQPTSISGRVYDPANVNPLYNVTVYLTSSTPGPITRGAHCASCSSVLTSPILGSAVTDANGDFRMVGEQMMNAVTTPPLPTGDNLNLVVQAGKWRKVYNVNVAACQDNPQPGHTLRLPKNSTEGNLPDIAISTGAEDSLECLLHRIGVDDSEYVAGASTGGHVHIFSSTNGAGGATIQGGSPEPGSALWDKASDVMPYDVVLLSCEGAETANLDDAGRRVLSDYLTNGGRVFASHFHYSLFTPTGPFAMQNPPLATWTTGAQLDSSSIAGKIVTATLPGGAPFPDGLAFAGWLGNVGALQNGELPIDRASDNSQVTAGNSESQLWITADRGSSRSGYAQYFSFDVPAGQPFFCGRVVYSDMHASSLPNGSAAAGADYAGTTPGLVPQGCSSRTLTPQEKAIEYTIFDLSSRCEPAHTSLPRPPPDQ